MKKVTRWLATDGREFDTKEKCIKYEKLINEIYEIMKVLAPPPKDDGCHFANGGSFIQHKKGIVRLVRLNLLNVVKRYITHKWIDQSIEDDTVHPSWVGRLIDDSNLRPLNSAWYRLMCIDEEYREWGQPYFAAHPEESEVLRKTTTPLSE